MVHLSEETLKLRYKNLNLLFRHGTTILINSIQLVVTYKFLFCRVRLNKCYSFKIIPIYDTQLLIKKHKIINNYHQTNLILF